MRGPWRLTPLVHTEGSYQTAESHFLQAASKDAARLFGKMMAEWYASVASSGAVSAGVFASHGVLPYVLLTSSCCFETDQKETI
jgi:hypothetical protein